MGFNKRFLILNEDEERKESIDNDYFNIIKELEEDERYDIDKVFFKDLTIEENIEITDSFQDLHKNKWKKKNYFTTKDVISFEYLDQIKEFSYEEKMKLVKDENTEAEILEVLSEEEDINIQYLIGIHQNTPNSVLRLVLDKTDDENKKIEIMFKKYRINIDINKYSFMMI